VAGLVLAAPAQDSIGEAQKVFRGRDKADWRAAADYLRAKGAVAELLKITEHRDVYARQLAFKALGTLEGGAVEALDEVIAGAGAGSTWPPVPSLVGAWLVQRSVGARSIPVEYAQKPDRKQAAALDRQYRLELVLRVGPHAPDALRPLIASDGPAGALTEGFSENRWIAVEAVHRLEAAQARPILTAWTADEDPGVAAAGVLGLGRLEGAGESHVKSIAPLLRSEHAALRMRAAAAISWIGAGCEETAQPLAALLHDEATATRLYAAAALGRCGDARAVPALLPILEGKDEGWVVEAAFVLRSFEPLPPSALPALADLLKSRNERVRLSALNTLAGYGPRAQSVLPAVRKRLKDKVSAVARAAQKALDAIESGAR
jgi:HEAT repeat protein